MTRVMRNYSIYARIRELEHSIVSLDCQLEDYEMVRMREKTNQVKRRMSAAVGGDEDGRLKSLTEDCVDMFLRNNNLWEKYKSG